MVKIRTILTILAYAVALLGFAPLFPFLGVFPRLVFGVALVGGMVCDWWESYPIRGLLSIAISLLFFGSYALQFSRDNVALPAVTILTLLQAVRLISEKSGRHYLQIFALAFFSLAASSLFDLSAIFLFYLAFLFLLIAVALVLLTFYAEDPASHLSRAGLKRVVLVSLGMPAAAIPLMLLFFVILPRAQFPLWHIMDSAGQQTSGFAETVELGRAAQVTEVKSVAFRVECARLAPRDLYWRCIVLNSLEGNSWVRAAQLPAEQPYPARGRIVQQQVYPEPGGGIYLPGLNVPRQINIFRVSQAADYVFTSKWQAGRRSGYGVMSVLTDTIRVRGGIDREFYLRLPPQLSTRLRAIGRDVAVRGTTAARRVALLEEYFRGQRLVYATSGLPIGDEPVDEFLFGGKRGNCEYFASSFALLLRQAGIPSRLVGGYYGGEYNELGGYYVVTADRAHVWVEAYLEGEGWVTIDPSRLAVNFANILDKPARPTLGRRLELAVDSLGYFWNQAVINYDLEKQLQLIRTANNEVKQLDFNFNRRQLGTAALVVVLLYLAWKGVAGVKQWQSSTREARLLREFLAKIGKRFPAAAVTPATGLRELAELLKDDRVTEFVSIYSQAIYREQQLSRDELRRLQQLVKSL